jgi:hypothetical protein
MNRITFDQPKPIEEIKEQYDIRKVSVLTTPNLYPLVKGIEFSGNASFVLAKKKVFPIKRKMDAHIEAYENAMLREWKKAQKRLRSLVGKVKEINKLDYNNKLTMLRIARIPTQYKKQFIDIADKYDLNLSILDKIVLNPSLMVNARYDSRKNLMEFNPDYLKQHGQIRIGDAGEYISETAKTFIHEFGHAYWYNTLTEEDRRAWQGLATFLTRDKLTGDMSQYLVGEKKRFDGNTMYSSFYTLRDEPFVSVYARFNFREDWAECFLYYKVAHKTLERMCPNKYSFLQDKVGNRIEKETLIKAFIPVVKDPKKLRDQVISTLENLKDGLSYKAREAYQRAYNLGRQKGAFYSDKPFNNKLETKDKERLQNLYARNDEYLDGFMDDLSEEYDGVLFTLAPTGFIEGIKEYDDIDEFDQDFEDVMDTQEHRLSIYAISGLSLALGIGLIEESKEDFGGGFWHTQIDERVCDGCERLNGQWMSYDEFLEIYGDQDCDGNCRCGELFEPSETPQGGAEGLEEALDMTMPVLAMERMVKGGVGSGRYPKGSGSNKPEFESYVKDVRANIHKEFPSLKRDAQASMDEHFKGIRIVRAELSGSYSKGGIPNEDSDIDIKFYYTGQANDFKGDEDSLRTEIAMTLAGNIGGNWGAYDAHAEREDAEKMIKYGTATSGRYPKGSGEEKKTYWEDLSESQKQEYKDRRVSEVRAIESLKFPLEATFSGEKVKILGSADSFEPYKSELKGRNADYTQLMVQGGDGKKFITLAPSLYVNDKPLISPIPPIKNPTFLGRQVKKSDKTVAVDYHGTLNIDGKLNESLKYQLQEMKNEGYHIIIYTSGVTHSPGSLNGIQTWLQEREVSYDEVWQRQGKPDADIYIEDKAVRPSEIQDKTVDEIEQIPEKEDDKIGG